MELTIKDIREQLKIHCPGEAFHADNKTHAELIANRFMDCTAILLAEIERIEKQTAEKWISVDDRLPEVGTWVNLYTDTASPYEEGWPVRLFNNGKDKTEVVCGLLAYTDEPEGENIGWGYWCTGFTAGGTRLGCINYVTHWQPLPPPPE